MAHLGQLDVNFNIKTDIFILVLSNDPSIVFVKPPSYFFDEQMSVIITQVVKQWGCNLDTSGCNYCGLLLYINSRSGSDLLPFYSVGH